MRENYICAIKPTVIRLQKCITKKVTLKVFKRSFFSSGIRQNGLPPALLRRAKSMSEEHEILDKQLQDKYDTILARRAGELGAVTQGLKQYEKALNNLSELRAMLEDKALDPDLRELAEEDTQTTAAEIADLALGLQRSLIPKHRYSHLPALIEIRPGTGGSEAALFANDLWHMYMAYCSIKSWPVNIVSTYFTDAGDGLLEGIFEVQMDGAYNEFRSEAGVHRVQRIPVTEKQGRVHTSTAIVMVLPSFPTSESVEGEEDPDSMIDMQDVRIDIMRARGAGGQHVNTTDSAVRMTHIPTGTVAACQETRSQIQNRIKCLAVLKSRVAEKRRAEREQEEQKLRKGAVKVASSRSDKMRTYNYSQNRITDHRASFSLHDLPGCMEGEGLDEMIKEVKKWQMEQDVGALIEN